MTVQRIRGFTRMTGELDASRVGGHLTDLAMLLSSSQSTGKHTTKSRLINPKVVQSSETERTKTCR
jgi:hypothetical protein